MSTLMDFAAVCELEFFVESMFYHKNRDWQRRHLCWKQHSEAIRRTGYGRAYAEPAKPDIAQIRKEVYRRF